MYRLHATIFQGYRDWCRHVDLPERVPELTMDSLLKGGEAVVSSLSRHIKAAAAAPAAAAARRRRMTDALLLIAI